MTKHAEFIHQRARVITGPGGTASHVAAPTETHSLTRPLACSVALHLGLATIVVVAGSAALVPLKAPRVAWLDLESADSPTPPHPAPVAATPRPRSAPRPIVEPRPIEPRQLPVPVTEGSVASPALPPPREVTALEPSPPAQSAPSPPQSASCICFEGIEDWFRVAHRAQDAVYVVRPSVKCTKYVTAIVAHSSCRCLHDLALSSVQDNGSMYELFAV